MKSLKDDVLAPVARRPRPFILIWGKVSSYSYVSYIVHAPEIEKSSLVKYFAG